MTNEVQAPRKRAEKPKVIGLQQLGAKKFVYLKQLPFEMEDSFGKLTMGFVMFIWGQSGHGKSTLVYQLIKALIPNGSALLLSLEEGTEATAQLQAMTALNLEEHNGKVLFADHTMTYEHLISRLKKKKSPLIVIVDSVQYWELNYAKYKKLKETFPKKIFIFISHAKGKNPDGKAADKIRYDSDIKVWVEGQVAFVRSRFRSKQPFVIVEDLAKQYWGRKFKKLQNT